jgi:hypothetical protein
MSPMENRREYAKLCWKSARQHWFMSILGSAFILYSGVQTFSQNLDWGPIGHLSERLPRLPLSWAIIIALAILVFILIEGGWRLRRDEIEEHNAKLQFQSDLHTKELLERDLKIAALLSTEKAPRIYLSHGYSIAGWRGLVSVSMSDLVHQMSLPIQVFNEGEQVAFEVEIEPIRHDKFMARFGVLAQVPARSHCYPSPTIYENDVERPEPWNRAFARMFVGILPASKPVPQEILQRMGFLAAIERNVSSQTSTVPKPDWQTPEEGDVPVVIKYRDASGKRKFISKCEIHYNRNDCTITTRQLGIETEWSD